MCKMEHRQENNLQREMMSVVTCPILAGQSVTVAAHEVIVYTEVAYTVEVVEAGSE